MTDASREASQWWPSRRLRLFLLLGILVALVAGIGLDIWAGRRVDAEFARLEKRYGSLDGRSVVAPAVPADDNRARFVRAAVALTVPANHDKSYSALLASFTRFEKLPESSHVPDDVRAFVDANREAIRLADEARNRHQSSWGVDYGGGDNPPLLGIRTLSNAIYFAALLDIEAGRPDDASRRIASGLAVTTSMQQEPALLPQLIRIAVAVPQCEAVRRLIVQSEPSRAALEDLAHGLVENRKPDPMQVGILGEMRHGNEALRTLETGRVTRLSDFASVSTWVGPLARIGRPLVRLVRINYLHEMERLIELQAGPRPRPPFPDSARPGVWHWRRFSYMFTAGLERAMDAGDQFNSMLGATELGVGLRRYRLDHGTYPDDLSALVPAYLLRLPVDAVTGRPPAYARRGAGFTLKAEAVRRYSFANSALAWTVPK